MRTGNADQNLAVIRHLALNLLKQEHSPKVGIQAKRKKSRMGLRLPAQSPITMKCNYPGNNPGLSHMDVGESGQDVDEEAVVPTGPFQFAPH